MQATLPVVDLDLFLSNDRQSPVVAQECKKANANVHCLCLPFKTESSRLLDCRGIDNLWCCDRTRLAGVGK
jgi:hypothetical protein